MTRRLYDDPDFVAAYRRLPRSVLGLHGAPEWPSLQALLPPLAGARVVDLGCGFGWFCRWARDEGAASVLGIDHATTMLDRARADTTAGADSTGSVEYRLADLDTFGLPSRSADLVHSALALHYVEDLTRLVGVVAAALVPGGSFVYSVEHPVFTAPRRPAFITDAEGQRCWPVDGYLDEGARTTTWLVDGVVKQHRTIATHVNTLIGAGFAVEHLEEWGPTDAQAAADPALLDERIRPTFLLIGARRV